MKIPSDVVNRFSGRLFLHETARFFAVLLLLQIPLAAYSFDQLTEPQLLVYETSHLKETREGSAISYTYLVEKLDTNESIEDKVSLSILKEHEDDRRDVSLEFLSGEFNLPLPDFQKYRGNPVIIGMLEHIAQMLGRETGGGTLYFRNRIRDRLADEKIEIVKSELEVSGDSDGNSGGNGKQVQTSFSFSPLANDPFVAENIALTESVITLTFSEDVPGNVVSINFVSGPLEKTVLTRALEYSGVE